MKKLSKHFLILAERVKAQRDFKSFQKAKAFIFAHFCHIPESLQESFNYHSEKSHQFDIVPQFHPQPSPKKEKSELKFKMGNKIQFFCHV